MNLNIKDTVSWSSATGDIEGVISNIILDLNAANHIVPWIHVKSIDKYGRKYVVQLCATHQNLKMLKITKLKNKTV
jgi:hypothetical protein